MGTSTNSSNPGNLFTIGGFDQDVNDNEVIDGYLNSDVYFVDGEPLMPTDFGKSFEGKWGPLDSEMVLENIKGKTKSPYSERPNYDQK